MSSGPASRRRLPAPAVPALLALGLATALLIPALLAALRRRRQRTPAAAPYDTTSARHTPATSPPRPAAQTATEGSRPAASEVPPVGRPEGRSRGLLLGAATVLAVVVGLSAVTVAESAPRPAEPVAAVAASPAPAPPRVYDHESLGAAWPEVREVLSETVATARAQGFELQMCVRALDSRAGEQHCEGREEGLYAASTIKLAVAVAALEKYRGRTDTRLDVRWEDIRGGSGSIKNEGAGRYTVAELVRRAIVVSDNSATVTLLRDLGSVEAANRATRRVRPTPAYQVANFSGALPTGGADDGRITARGAADYLTALVGCARGVDCTLTSREVATTVLGHMRKQEIVTKIGLYLEPGTYATKGGDMDHVSHDIGVVDTGRGHLVLTAVSTAADPSYPDWIIAAGARDIVAALDAD